MRNLLEEAVAELHLEPGQTYRTTVNDVEVQFRRPVAAGAPKNLPNDRLERQTSNPPMDEPRQFADAVMLMPWFDSPPPQHVVTVRATFGPLPFPDPPVVPPDDEVAE